MSEQDDTIQTDDTDAPEEAETFEVPEDLTDLSTGDLETLTGKVTARGQELRANVARLTDAGLAEAEELALVADELAAEATRRKADAADRAERATSALSRFAVDDEAADDEPAADDAADDEPATADAGELAADTDDDGEKEPDVADTDEGAAMSSRPARFTGASPAFLKERSKAAAPRKQTQQDFMFATAFSKDVEGTRYESPADVALALWKRRMSMGNVPAGVREEISIATGTKTFPDEAPMVLGLDPQENLAIIRGSQEALVASGAQCTPQNQLYDFFRLAQPIRDVEDCLPTVQAPRGGIRYIQANCTIQGAGAVGVWGGLTPGSIDPVSGEKPCDTVTCPNISEVLVEAVSKCMVFDNLQFRTFPELIENFMEDVGVQFTLTKQRYYLDAIDRAATATTGIGAYGAARALLYDFTVAAVGYRKRHHMPRNSRVQALIPDWAIDLWKADLFYDGDNGLDFMNVPDSAVLEALASRNIDACFYYDSPTQVQANEDNESVGLTLAQAAGALNDYAPTVTSYMYAPGTWVKLDGGSLDVGLVRDHALNQTNDFSMFMEEWLGIAQMGCETIRIDSTVCADGSRAPYAAALRACAGYSGS
jgi:hypothetical protein